MNERIKELATLATRQYSPTYYTQEWIQGFAELIVRECVGIVAKRKDQAIEDSWNVDEAMSLAEMDLEEHFGVES